MRSLLVFFLFLFGLGALRAMGQNITTANQGAPGRLGPWPVSVAATTLADGGTSIPHSINPVTTAVTCAVTATAAPTTVTARRTSGCFYNNSAVTIYLGGSGVTTANGFPLGANTAWCDAVSGIAYYCIVSSGTAELRVLEN